MTTPTPPDTLRRAASLMRERARLVFCGNWKVDPHEPQQWLSGALIVGESSEDDVALHCASWHPAVALAVADLLDLVSVSWSLCEGRTRNAAVTLSHAYLEGPVPVGLEQCNTEVAANAWDEAIAHVARVARVGSAGLNDECFEGNPYRDLPAGGA